MSGDDGDGDDGDGGGARQDETEFDFAIFITDVAMQSRQNVSSRNTISFIFSQPRLFDVVGNVATRPPFFISVALYQTRRYLFICLVCR